MKTTLIGDIGSTKAQWALLKSEEQLTFETKGFNPVLHEESLLQEMWKTLRDDVPGDVDEIYYYGTGIISDASRRLIIEGCRKTFGKAEITCESDILGTAHAVSAGKEGIIAILGTGSNSCMFDGIHIVKQIPSLGFPLGDEGGGADIGKACVRAFYYGLMPDDVRASFESVLPANRELFLSQFRTHKAGNRFLAALVPVVAKHLNSQFIRSLLLERFRTFARLHLTPYPGNYPVHVVGGVAFVFQDLLINALEQENLQPGTIVKSPLPGLIAFHQKYHT
jgi:N-acetylglucosamine kinase-like BadF-type ATPase